MDPYLERHWLDVHARLVLYAADSLNEKLPRSLVARTEERIAIDSEDAVEDRKISPDVRVIEPAAGNRATEIAYEAPLKLMLDDPIIERFIQIQGVDDERLIAVIEVVSPTNKSGNGLKEYRKKREELIESGVHVVEIDLVRQGNWRALMRPHACARNHWSEYRVTVRLGGDRQTAYVHPAPLRRPLPSFAIPLREGDPEVKLNLQELVNLAYARGRYGETLNYTRPLDVPLSDEDAAWVKQIMQRNE